MVDQPDDSELQGEESSETEENSSGSETSDDTSADMQTVESVDSTDSADDPTPPLTTDDAGDTADASAASDDDDLAAAWGDAESDLPTGTVTPIKEPTMDYATQPPTSAHPVEFPDLGESSPSGNGANIDMLMDVELPVSIELGRTNLPISDILHWTQGSIVELDKLAGESVDLLVNNKVVARGEVVVIDENFGLRITQLLTSTER